MLDRDESVRLMAAKFRASMAEHLAEPPWKALLKRLQHASPEFREVWARHEVLRPGDKVKVFRQARVGSLRLTATSLWTGPNSGPRLVAYTPVDAETHERLEKLHALVKEGDFAASGGS
ncbi:DNA-binding protein [Streptomyces bingchenggensis BCW-1]|uniref:DNA-binding protein n=1 Tax=Streptomyces bingchenggensis (strain BCW-1) TaxID=749414 RepID=D7C5H9_STRBB|nr:DNA-binding protein [Streptomyces bingchenggensis BCW-1]